MEITLPSGRGANNTYIKKYYDYFSFKPQWRTYTTKGNEYDAEGCTATVIAYDLEENEVDRGSENDCSFTSGGPVALQLPVPGDYEVVVKVETDIGSAKDTVQISTRKG